MSCFELTVSSEMENLTTISDFVTSVASNLGLSEDDTFALQMAVDEACANVIEHAYGGRRDGSIHITCQALQDRVVVTVQDHGKPFDPHSVPRPKANAPLEERLAGGLGILLIEKLMDEVRFEFDAEKGNVLTMVKKRQVEKQPL